MLLSYPRASVSHWLRSAEKVTMATIKQIRANRRNAKKSTGPKTPEGKARTRFNSLVHGLRAESAVIPGEDQAKFDQQLERLSKAWMPQDDFEKSLVEQIAVNQWKLARLDRSEARLHEDSVPPGEFALAIHRLYLTQARLERSVSSAIADLERYRKQRIARQDDDEEEEEGRFQAGLLWLDDQDKPHYSVLPQIRGIDGVYRYIPAEVLGDYPDAGQLPATEPNG
jgi:hypothetical protein